MQLMFPAEFTELIPLQPIRIILLIFIRRIVPLFANCTSQVDDFTHLLLRNSSSVMRQSWARVLLSNDG
jgi:hypothetical protein